MSATQQSTRTNTSCIKKVLNFQYMYFYVHIIRCGHMLGMSIYIAYQERLEFQLQVIVFGDVYIQIPDYQNGVVVARYPGVTRR